MTRVLNKGPAALQFQTRQIEIRPQRRQRLLAHDHARRARAGECIHLTFAEAPFGAQLGAFGLHGLNLRLQRADPELGDPVVDLHQHLAGFDLHTLAHGKIGDPAVGTARYRHHVGRDARIVFIDMGQPQMQLAAAIDESDTEQGGDAQEARPQQRAHQTCLSPCTANARQHAGRRRGTGNLRSRLRSRLGGRRRHRLIHDLLRRSQSRCAVSLCHQKSIRLKHSAGHRSST